MALSRALVVDPRTGSATEIRIPFAVDHRFEYLESAAMNNEGDVVGAVTVDAAARETGVNGMHAFFWNFASQQAIDLGTLAGGASMAYDINDSGQIVGWSDGSPFVWDPATQEMKPLASGFGSANSINDYGQIAGILTASPAADDGGEMDAHTVVWDLSTGGFTDLGVEGCGGRDINNEGEIAGTLGERASCVWDPISQTSVEVPETQGGLSAINDHAQIVGYSNGPALWNPNQ